LVDGESATGGGSLPATPIPTVTLAVSTNALPAEELARRLREQETPVIARIVKDEVILDARTLLDGEDRLVVAALREAIAEETDRCG
jgi:L-seryl-tRNA(Ser) seleniumtransferase